MPFPFHLPTTSQASFTASLTSSSHPSLPLTATSYRSALRNALKAHKRLPPAQQAGNLPAILSAVTVYIPYITLLSNSLLAPEQIVVTETSSFTAEWRPTLTQPPPGLRSPNRAKIHSLNDDLLFALLTLGQTYYLMARAALQALHAAHTSSSAPTPDQRTTALAAAMKHYLTAHSIFSYAASSPPASPSSPADISSPTLHALAALALSSATLLAPAKDDPYPSLIASNLNPNSKCYLFGAPTIPHVRALLFARLCIAAADHASTALSHLASVPTLDPALRDFADDLRRCARAKAFRFMGIDADGAGSSGESVGWARAALAELRLSPTSTDKGPSLSRLKASLSSKREDRRVEKGGEWGADAGGHEEGRVCGALEAKWSRANDTVGVQDVPNAAALLAKLPGGREYHRPTAWEAPRLGTDVLSRTRAPPVQRGDGLKRGEESSGDEGEGGGVPGSFVEGTATGSQYY